MPFFVINIINEKEQYAGMEIKFFNDETEKNDFLNSNLEKNEKVYSYKSDTLFDVITQIGFQDFSNGGDNELVFQTYYKFVEEFGIDLINKEFPSEIVNNEFVENVLKQCDKIFEEIMDDYYENDADKEEQDYSNMKADWEEIGDEELRRWDEETGGSWRIENDFG